MESAFLIAADPILSEYGDIIPQHPIFNYRADFAIPDCLIVIEIDGYDWHKTREQLTADSRRQRALTAAGWCVVRFTGQEVYEDAVNCAAEVARIIVGRSGGGRL
jgi:very-short-patch-repair endonuclease